MYNIKSLRLNVRRGLYLAAYKSIKYYQKTKNITLLMNANNALLEIQKISIAMMDVLKLSNTNISRGKSVAIEIINGKEFFKHDQNFELCQERFNDIFEYLKECVEKHQDKLT